MTDSVTNASVTSASAATVLVTGASGLLGLNLSLSLQDKTRVVGICHQTHLQNTPFELIEADLTDRQRLEQVLNSVKPDVIVNCAALASLDRCEENPELAQRINAEMPGWLATWSNNNGCRLVHISTDAVFDGVTGGYRETDPTHPLGRYAITKLGGEQNVLMNNPDALVCRVVFYGCSTSGKRSLVEYFYNNLSAGNSVNGFTDVFFCPLFVMDLSNILWRMIQRRLSGLYHVVSPECLSKYDFGVQVARTFGFSENLIKPISWRDAGLRAARSPNLRLLTGKIQNALGEAMPDQAAGLQGFRKQVEAGYPIYIKSFVKMV